MRPQKKPAASEEPNRLDQIYYVAAKIFCDKGYDATSMSDIADAVGITKAGIYHYVKSKQDLLFAIMNFGMDRLETHVITPARAVADAEQRLRAIIRNHALLIISGSAPEGYSPLTVLNDEIAGLTPAHRRRVLQRKRVYLDLMRDTLRQLKSEGKLKEVDATVAAFSMFGMLLWLSRWYRPDGKLTGADVANEIEKIALGGLLRPQARLARN
ncbi:MAG: HTH-type transcriptional repressor KstR2 [Acidobacteria bacterium]|nr:HTH-type transcriptional repressor KstR2 [Acidobacteriota bacterium]